MKMKMKLPSAAAFAALCLCAACNPGAKSEPGTGGAGAPARTNTNQATNSGASSAAPAPDLSTLRRQAFNASAQESLNQLDTGIRNLAQKAQAYVGTTRTNADLSLSGLTRQREQVQARLEAMKSVGADTWNDASSGFASALAELQTQFESAISLFNRLDAEKASASAGAPPSTSQN